MEVKDKLKEKTKERRLSENSVYTEVDRGSSKSLELIVLITYAESLKGLILERLWTR